MTRILLLALIAAPILFWSKLTATLSQGAAVGVVIGAPGSWRWRMLQFLAGWVSSFGLSDTALTILTFASVLYAFVMGFAFDAVLKERGFGPLLSGTLSFFGAALAIALWVSYSDDSFANSPSHLVIAAGIGSALAIAIAAILKAALNAVVDQLVVGAKGAAAQTRLQNASMRRRPEGNGF